MTQVAWKFQTVSEHGCLSGHLGLMLSARNNDWRKFCKKLPTTKSNINVPICASLFSLPCPMVSAFPNQNMSLNMRDIRLTSLDSTVTAMAGQCYPFDSHLRLQHEHPRDVVPKIFGTFTLCPSPTSLMALLIISFHRCYDLKAVKHIGQPMSNTWAAILWK